MSAKLAVVDTDEGESTPAFAESLKVAVYAATGGRKTLQIGHLIERFGHENVFIISCEHGLGTIQSLIKPEQVFVAEDMTAFRKAFGWAKERAKSPDQWLCVDGGSRVLQWVSEDLWGGVYKAYEQVLDGVKPTELPAALRPYAVYLTSKDGINSQGVWIRVGMESTRLFNSFVRLPCSMYWTFWEELTNVDQYTKGFPLKPDTPGKGSLDALKGTFDFIIHLVKEGDVSTAQCNDGVRQYYAKRRDDWRAGVRVPDEIKSFRLDEFVSNLRGPGFGQTA
jgi:hypothetical protein